MKDNCLTDKWTFNLRTCDILYSSDDSDSEDPSRCDEVSEQTRLINDLDLSAREDAVVYKPNPFSIAKINAASRVAHLGPDSVPAATLRPGKPKVDTKQPKGSTIDSFKKQAQRPQNATGALALKPGRNSERLHQATPTNSGTTKLEKLKPPKNKPFQPLTPKLMAQKRAGTLNSSPLIAPNIKPSTINQHTMPYSMNRTIRPSLETLEYPHIHGKNISADKPVIQTPSKIRPHARPYSFSSPVQPQPRNISGMFPLSGITCENDFDNLPLSSPIRPPSSHRPVTTIRPINVPSRSLFSTNPVSMPLSPPFSLRSPTGTSMTLTNQNVQVQHPTASLPNLSIPQDSDQRLCARTQEMNTEPPVTPTHGTPALDHQFSSNPPKIPEDVERPLKNKEETPYLHYTPENIDYESHPPISEGQSPKLISQTQIEPEYVTTSRKRKDLSSPASPRTRLRKSTDAYNFMASNPDEEWSTLPARKKFKPSQKKATSLTGMKTTGMLRLPQTLLSKSVANSGISATSERRVVTYLPPPLATIKGKTHGYNEDSRIQAHIATPNKIPQNTYPSPTSSPKLFQPQPVSSDKLRGTTSPKAPTQRDNKSPYCPLSPPTSDLPVPVSPEPIEPTVHIDVDSIARNYPGTKAKLRKYRRACAEFWDLLQLPSCGRVYVDKKEDDGEEEGKKEEMGIVIWGAGDAEIT